MAHSFDIVAYMYQADFYCSACMEEIALGGSWVSLRASRLVMMSTEQILNRWAAKLKLCREEEETYDSDEFPKVVFRDQLDGDEHCCGRCHCNLEDE